MNVKIFFLLATLALSGCLTSQDPLPDSKETGPDSPLIGYWIRPADNDGYQTYEVLTVFPSEKVSGRLALIESIGQVFEPAQADVAQAAPDTDVYDFYISRINERTFADLQDRSDDSGKHIIMRYVYDGGNQLNVWNISDKFADAIEKNLRSTRTGMSELGQASDLVRTLSSLTEADLDKPFNYTRWTGDVASLKKKVAAGP